MAKRSEPDDASSPLQPSQTHGPHPRRLPWTRSAAEGQTWKHPRADAPLPLPRPATQRDGNHQRAPWLPSASPLPSSLAQSGHRSHPSPLPTSARTPPHSSARSAYRPLAHAHAQLNLPLVQSEPDPSFLPRRANPPRTSFTSRLSHLASIARRQLPAPRRRRARHDCRSAGTL
ncbi:hypothetical protein PUNSTDRAFT_144675, partial [Punctularia strigosozonata HHB-11173 SS5]|uniref:uncharacterized protein n=1 Tax=Punctularia strigosozonata (strain HHB-11173) TaxID=741275 RepID=UPI0004416E42